MKRHEKEELFREHVAAWVAKQEGRWSENVSDKFLTAILVRLTGLPPDDTDEKPDVGYQAACTVFETCIEHGCDVRANGHHVAQAFNVHLRAFRPVAVSG